MGIGSGVRLKDLQTGEELDFILVSPAEADPSDNRLSYESPVGKAILGKSVGAVVEVDVPAGRLAYEILEVRPPGTLGVPAGRDGSSSSAGS